jgi:SAM-dependent methyltransferase
MTLEIGKIPPKPVIDFILVNSSAIKITEGATFDRPGIPWHNSQNEALYLMPIKVTDLIKNSPLVNAPWKMLDIGCYTAHYPEFLIANGFNNIPRYVGVDFDKAALNRAGADAREIFKASTCQECSFYERDIFKNGSFLEIPDDNNFIVCTGVINKRNFQDLKYLLDNVNLLMRKDSTSRFFINFATFNKDIPAQHNEEATYLVEGEHNSLGITCVDCLFPIRNSNEKSRSTAYDEKELEALIKLTGFQIDEKCTFRTDRGMRFGNIIYGLQVA